MNAYTCPFCGMLSAAYPGKTKSYFLPPVVLDQMDGSGTKTIVVEQRLNDDQVCITFQECPACGKEGIFASREKGSDAFQNRVYPPYQTVGIPEYVPEAIRTDYSEAAAIVYISPKSSAVLCRRCLQGMIRDCWEIREGTLASQIGQLQGRISPRQWDALNSLRTLGNIGAHMEKDVNLIIDVYPAEAEMLLHLIEMLIKEWYVNRHEEQELLDRIVAAGQRIHAQRQASRDDGCR